MRRKERTYAHAVKKKAKQANKNGTQDKTAGAGKANLSPEAQQQLGKRTQDQNTTPSMCVVSSITGRIGTKSKNNSTYLASS